MANSFNIFMDEHFARGPFIMDIMLSGRIFRLHGCLINNHKPEPVPEGETPNDRVLEIVYTETRELYGDTE